MKSDEESDIMTEKVMQEREMECPRERARVTQRE